MKRIGVTLNKALLETNSCGGGAMRILLFLVETVLDAPLDLPNPDFFKRFALLCVIAYAIFHQVRNYLNRPKK